MNPDMINSEQFYNLFKEACKNEHLDLVQWLIKMNPDMINSEQFYIAFKEAFGTCTMACQNEYRHD